MASLESLYQEMNIFIADQMVMSMKIHNVHWNLKGNSFFTLHPLMDQYYEEHIERIDAVAERLIAIGGQPVGSLKGSLDVTSIQELDDKKIGAEAMVNALIVDFTKMREQANRIIEMAEELKDYGTADYFTAEIQVYDKELWMLNSYLDKA